jgi:Xaa-Pro aminopeptidase
MAEIEVALELERYMRLAGAEGKSFDITVASGVRSSMPHGTASHKLLAAAELVTLDYGCVVDGYHSDMTRTLALGEVSEDAQRLYQAVLEAQESALAAIHAGVDGQAVDKVARDSLTAAGYGDYFSHSLGHGVGLEIHEYPRMSPIVSEILAANMAITVEPGAYIPGDMGVRIEDLVIVTEDGIENLSHSPKHLISL